MESREAGAAAGAPFAAGKGELVGRIWENAWLEAASASSAPTTPAPHQETEGPRHWRWELPYLDLAYPGATWPHAPACYLIPQEVLRLQGGSSDSKTKTGGTQLRNDTTQRI